MNNLIDRLFTDLNTSQSVAIISMFNISTSVHVIFRRKLKVRDNPALSPYQFPLITYQIPLSRKAVPSPVDNLGGAH